jgi:hypothetical protein
MTEFCEGVELPAPDTEEPRKDKKTGVNVRCIMLFDGTMNNKTNIQSRIDRDEFYKTSISKWKKIKHSVASVFNENANAPTGGTSYENGFTNIATLDKHVKTESANGYHLVVKIYTEGAGTIDNKGDKTLGYGMGVGKAGVIKKCEKGIREAVVKIITGEINGEAIDPSTQYIEKLTIDVFGFSRGAATARYCIHKVLKDDIWQIRKLLAAKEVEATTVQVWFAGLFDTVSSHGVSFKNDTRALELDAVIDAAKTLHLVAGDEHRKNFSVTNINSTAKKGGEEYFMPGAHSDVGGSYLEFSDECFQLNSGWIAEIESDRGALIERNWYTAEEIITDINYESNTALITANRKGISNAYCNIPLKLMATGAKNQKIIIDPLLYTDADAAIKKADLHFGNNDLSKLDASIINYMQKNIESFEKIANTKLLRRIRHSYLHMSSKDEFGLTPRFKLDLNKSRIRWRCDYGG